MDEEDVWWFFSWFDSEPTLVLRTEKTDEDWIGWMFVSLGILLMTNSIIAVIYSVIN